MTPNQERALRGNSMLFGCDFHLKTHQGDDEFDRVVAFGEMANELRPTCIGIGGDLVEFVSIMKSVVESPAGFDRKFLEQEKRLFRMALQAILSPRDVTGLSTESIFSKGTMRRGTDILGRSIPRSLCASWGSWASHGMSWAMHSGIKERGLRICKNQAPRAVGGFHRARPFPRSSIATDHS